MQKANRKNKEDLKFGLSHKDWALVLNLVINPLKKQKAKVWIFGSRARGNFKPFSDLDIVFENQEKFPQGFLSKIIEAVEESNLVIKVDLVSFDDLAESYKESVLKERVEV